MGRPSFVQCLFQRVEHEAGMRRPAHPPADDPSRIGVDDKGDIDEARPGRDVGEVGDPQHVRRRGMELAIDVIERAWCRLVAHRGADRLAADDAFEAHGLHQAGDRAAGDIEALALQLPPDLADAVDAEVRLEHTSDLILQSLIPLRPSRQPGRIDALGDMVVVGRRGDRQHLADRLDPMRLAVIVDERDHGLNRRSSSAWAK